MEKDFNSKFQKIKIFDLPLRKLFILLFVIYLVVSFYFWTSTFGFNTFNQKPRYFSYYNLLTDGFLSGKLSVPLEPTPKLLASNDPYDPIATREYRFHDLVLYKGKYFILHGPVPVLIFYIPYKLLTKHYITENLVIFLFSSGAFVFSCLLLVHIWGKYFNQTSFWMIALLLLILGFGNFSGVLMRRPMMYEVAISSSIFFLLGAIYFLFTSINSQKISLWKAFLGSLFLGVGVGCRPNVIMTGLLTIFFFLWFIRKSIEKKELIKVIFTVSVPFTICLICISLYNYFRFENPFEFGARYQLTLFNYNLIGVLHPENIILNLYLFLFTLPKIDNIFPFIHIDWINTPDFIPKPQHTGMGRTVGILPAVPFLFTALIYPVFSCFNFLLKENKNNKTMFPKAELLIILTPGLVNLIIDSMIPSNELRYRSEIAIFLILAACIIMFYYENKLKFFLKLVLNFFTIGLSVISIILGMAFSIEVAEDNLKNQNPKEYAKLESYFKNACGLSKFTTIFLQDQIFLRKTRN